MVVTKTTLPTLPRVRLMAPQIVFARLPEDRRSMVEAFVQESNSPEGRELKRQAMADLFTHQPYLSLKALKSITECVNKSTQLDGRRTKLEGFTRLYRNHPGLRDDVLDEVVNLVNGSNSSEGYKEKLQAVNKMLALQPGMRPKFLQQVRLLVDHSTGVPARAMKLDAVVSMLEKNPYLKPETLGHMRAFVNESNSVEGRRLKLGTLNYLLQRCPTLDDERIKALGTAVNKDPDLPARRVALRALEQAFRWQPAVSAESLTAMTSFIYQERTIKGLEERAGQVTRLLRLDPKADVRHVKAQADTALTPVDGTLRARVAVNDMLVADRLGMSVERMLALSTVSSSAGATAAAGLLHPDSPLSMAQDTLQVCRERTQHFTDAAALPSEKLLRVYELREREVRQKYLYKVAVTAAAAAVLGGGAAMAASCFVSVSVPAMWGITAAAAGLSLFYGKVQVDRAAERHVRDELSAQRDYWRQQLDTHERIEPAIESLLAGQKATIPGVHEREEVVVIGAVRVRRKAEEE